MILCWQILTFCVHALNTVGKILKPPFSSLEYQTAEEGLNYFNKVNHYRDSRKDVNNGNNRSFSGSMFKSNDILNSTQSEDVSETFFQDFEKSIFSLGNETIEKQVQIDKEDEVNKCPEVPSSETLSQSNDSESSRPTVIVGSEQNVNTTNSDSHSGNEIETNEKELVVNEVKTNGKEFVEQRLSSEVAKKRNLEEVENSLSKKTKMNGVSEEHFLTVEDSDDEMLSSFVDEVIDE